MRENLMPLNLFIYEDNLYFSNYIIDESTIVNLQSIDISQSDPYRVEHGFLNSR